MAPATLLTFYYVGFAGEEVCREGKVSLMGDGPRLGSWGLDVGVGISISACRVALVWLVWVGMLASSKLVGLCKAATSTGKKRQVRVK